MVALRLQLSEIVEISSRGQRLERTWVWAYRFPGGFLFTTPCGRQIRVRETQLKLALMKATAELQAA